MLVGEALRVKLAAAAAPTVMLVVAGVMLVATVSITVTVCVPGASGGDRKETLPVASVVLAGSVELVSVLVNFTVPVYPVALLLKASKADTVRLVVLPAVMLVGEALSVKLAAVPALTVMLVEAAVMLVATVSITVTV